MVDIEDVFKVIREGWEALNRAEAFSLLLFKQNLRHLQDPIFNSFGAYIIYNKDQVAVYVGSAYKRTLKQRIGDLFRLVKKSDEVTEKRGRFYHDVTKRLAGKDPKRYDEATRDLEEHYTVKVVPAKDSDEAKLLEQAFIILLGHPDFNDKNVSGYNSE